MKNKVTFLGIDIGGAHVKTVGLCEQKKIIFVSQDKVILWKNTELLEKYFLKLNKLFGKIRCGITMTGELCDFFKSRKHGVDKIIKTSKSLKFKTYFFTNKKENFLRKSKFSSIASMNWLATGKFLEKKIKDALIIDFGSTTTDLIFIKNYKIRNKFFSDFDRINNNELVYTGLTRTPTPFLSNLIVIGKKKYNLASEFFSNTGDLYRIKKLLPPGVDLLDSADGKSKSFTNSLRRLARNLCLDYKKNNTKILEIVAEKLIEIQMNKIFKESKKLIKKNISSKNIPLIVCGIGKKIIQKYAKKNDYKIIDFEDFLIGEKKMKLNASFHAPASSCAFLISELK